jgi:hypothetical protein
MGEFVFITLEGKTIAMAWLQNFPLSLPCNRCVVGVGAALKYIHAWYFSIKVGGQFFVFAKSIHI